MKKLSLLFLFVFFSVSCQGQKSDLQWKDFESKDAGMKINIPCEPKKFFKSFQDNPRHIHVYDFSCETEGIKFLVSSKNYMDDFNDKTFKQTFDAIESGYKTMFGEVENFNDKDVLLANGFPSRSYGIKYKNGAKIKSLVILNQERSYTILVGMPRDNERKLKESKISFDEVSKKFIESFQILDK